MNRDLRFRSQAMMKHQSFSCSKLLEVLENSFTFAGLLLAILLLPTRASAEVVLYRFEETLFGSLRAIAFSRGDALDLSDAGGLNQLRTLNAAVSTIPLGYDAGAHIRSSGIVKRGAGDGQYDFGMDLEYAYHGNRCCDGAASAAGYVQQVFDFEVIGSTTVSYTGSGASNSVGSQSPFGPSVSVLFRQGGREFGPGRSLFSGNYSFSSSISLGAGRYEMILGIHSNFATVFELAGWGSYSGSVFFQQSREAPGFGQPTPILPNEFAENGDLLFSDVRRASWIDPPFADRYRIGTTDGALITRILSLPEGFLEAFEVSVDGTSVGTFRPDQSVDFVKLLGHGVAQFEVGNIRPYVDSTNPAAFPIQLDFNREYADIRMSPLAAPIPEPSSSIAFLTGLAALVVLKGRKLSSIHASVSEVMKVRPRGTPLRVPR